MPELPEAETIARKLHADLAGKRLGRVLHLRRNIVRHGPARVPRWLDGAKVLRVARRGKRPMVHLEGDRGIIFFLGMTGRLAVQAAGDPVDKHTHLRMQIRSRRRELRFTDYRRFGGLAFFDASTGCVPLGIADLGPEPLEMPAAVFRKIATRRRQFKALLLDQHVIAGLGNIYCDEALHRAGIHPLDIAADVDGERVARLIRAIKQVLRAAIRYEGTTVLSYAHPDGPGAFQDRLRVYGHAGDPCRTCRTPIEVITAAGRTTHFCPQCQRPTT